MSETGNQTPVINPAGFREYDARWRYPDDINLAGMEALGLGLGTQMRERGLAPRIVAGHDFRSYSREVLDALIEGLVNAGIEVLDIGLSLTPMAYFAQFHLGVDAVAMVTASHNPNGWTGVKMGFEPPLTHGPEDMARLRDIVLGHQGEQHPGGGCEPIEGVREAYIADLTRDFRMTRPLRLVCATGNGTAGAFAPEILERIGVEVIGRHTELDHSFPHYNPNPEALEMLHDMGQAVRKSGADFGLGFDGAGIAAGWWTRRARRSSPTRWALFWRAIWPACMKTPDLLSMSNRPAFLKPTRSCANLEPGPNTGKLVTAT
jgi:phosphomannomutase/phosphoglucomutase